MLVGKPLCNENSKYIIDTYYKGSNFELYSVKDNPNLLIKVYPIKSWITEDYVENEAYFWKIASELQVAPNYITHTICPSFIIDQRGVEKKYGFLIIEKYGIGSLTDLIIKGIYETNKEEINKKLKYILDTLYDNNIDQGDLHSNNFLYDIIDGEIIIKIIDFDMAKLLESKKRNYTIRVLGEDDKELGVINLENIEKQKGGNFIRKNKKLKTRKNKKLKSHKNKKLKTHKNKKFKINKHKKSKFNNK
jgi:hypothetical protein